MSLTKSVISLGGAFLMLKFKTTNRLGLILPLPSLSHKTRHVLPSTLLRALLFPWSYPDTRGRHVLQMAGPGFLMTP